MTDNAERLLRYVQCTVTWLCGSVNYWWSFRPHYYLIFSGSEKPISFISHLEEVCLSHAPRWMKKQGRFTASLAACYFIHSTQDRNSPDSAPKFLLIVPTVSSEPDDCCGPTEQHPAPSWLEIRFMCLHYSWSWWRGEYWSWKAHASEMLRAILCLAVFLDTHQVIFKCSVILQFLWGYLITTLVIYILFTVSLSLSLFCEILKAPRTAL